MMKKVCLLILIMVLGKISYSQYPIQQYIGSDSAIVTSKGGLQGRLINWTYPDTATANNQRIRQYPGAQIATINGGLNLWVRNATATGWLPLAVGSGNNIYTIDGTLLGNRELDGDGYGLNFAALRRFGADGDSVYFIFPFQKYVAGNQELVLRGDTAYFKKRVSYDANLGNTFTQFSLVDKNYVDSVVASSPSGTVTSVATNDGTGITGGTITTTGTLAIDTTVISTRAWRQKGIDSVAALINNNVAGSTNYVSKFTGTNTIGNSQIYDNGTNVGVGTISPAQKLDINGNAYVNGQLLAGDTSVSTIPIQGANFNPTVFGRKAVTNTLSNDPRTIGVLGQTIARGSVANRLVGGAFFTQTDSSNSQNISQLRALQGWTIHNGTGTVTNAWGSYNVISNYQTGTITNAYGGVSGVENRGTGTINKLHGKSVEVWNNWGGSIDSVFGQTISIYNSNAASNIGTVYGLSIGKGLISPTGGTHYWRNSGTIGTSYGLYLDSSIDVGINKYSIYSFSNSPSYFRGSLGLGTSSPDSMLTVTNGALFQRGVRMSGLPVSPGTKQLRIDASGNISYTDTLIDAGGTVTSVATGYGLSGGTITTSGTLLVDSATLSAYYLRRKDSLTATNSLGYVTKTTLADTAAAIRGAAVTGFVPYTGATQNVNLGEYGLKTGFVGLDTTPTGTPTDKGTLYWEDNTSTVSLIMNGTIQRVGQSSYYYVKNETGTLIPKGTAVRFDGTDGGSGHLLIAPFLADGTYPSTYFMGITSEDIDNGGFGQVIAFGRLDGVNTNSFVDGDILYASTTVAGGFQTTVPQAPNNIVQISAVINAANNGKMLVRPTIGSNINNDEGVKITSPTSNSILVYNTASGLWVDTTLNAIGGVTGSLVSGYITKATGTNTIDTSQIYQNAGLVGIGTISPTFKLTVSSDASFYGVRVGRGKYDHGSNTVVGYLGLGSSTTGTSLTSIGFASLYSNTTGSSNTAVGSNSLYTNISGSQNTAVGANSLTYNTASDNSAFGYISLSNNISGTSNAAFGSQAGLYNSSGSYNTAIGTDAIAYVNTGSNNTALGYRAGYSPVNVGQFNQTPSNSLYIGYMTRAAGNGNNTNEIVIGASADGNGSNSVTLGNASITKTVLRENVGVGTTAPDSALTVQNGTHLKRGVRMSGLPAAPGTRSLRIDASGTVSISDTLANGISGTGTTNYIPKFTGTSTIGNSQIFDNGTNVGIGTATPEVTLAVYNASTPKIHLQNSTSGVTDVDGFQLAFSSSDGYIWNFENGGIRFATNNTERMRLDASGNLGLGTSSPSTKLDVNGTGKFSGKLTVDASVSGDVITNLVNNSATGFGLRTVGGASGAGYALSVNNYLGTELMQVNGAGNLGLGVTPSAWGASYKAIQISSFAAIAQGGNDTYIGNNWYNDGSNKYLQPSGASLYGQSNGSHFWFNAPSGTAGNAISFTQAMTLDASGNLAIGNTSASYKLDVTGTGRFTGSGNALRVQSSSNDVWQTFIPQTGDIWRIQATTGSNLGFYNETDGAFRMVIDGSGNVGIGTTSPAAALHINSSGTTNMYIQSAAANGAVLRYFVGTSEAASARVDASGNYYIETGLGSPTERMRITSGGNVLVGTSTDAGYKLYVNGTIATNDRFRATNYNGLSYPYNTSFGDGTDASFTQLFAGSTAGYESGIYVYGGNTSPANTVLFKTASTERMRITNGGNVLIGTTTDVGAKLYVNGDVNFQNSIGGGLITSASSKSAVLSSGETNLNLFFATVGGITTQQAYFSGNAVGGDPLFFTAQAREDGTNSVVTIGDVTVLANGTTIQVDDINSRINIGASNLSLNGLTSSGSAGSLVGYIIIELNNTPYKIPYYNL